MNKIIKIEVKDNNKLKIIALEEDSRETVFEIKGEIDLDKVKIYSSTIRDKENTIIYELPFKLNSQNKCFIVEKTKDDDNNKPVVNDNDKHLKGYMFDSLVYRFKDYQSKAFQMEVTDYKYERSCSEIQARGIIQGRHERDLMRFIQILDEAIGEHD